MADTARVTTGKVVDIVIPLLLVAVLIVSVPAIIQRTAGAK